MDINGVPLRISPLMFKNAFMSPSMLSERVIRHLISSVSACLTLASWKLCDAHYGCVKSSSCVPARGLTTPCQAVGACLQLTCFSELRLFVEAVQNRS